MKRALALGLMLIATAMSATELTPARTSSDSVTPRAELRYDDVLGRLTRSTRDLGNGQSVTTVFTYDDSTPGQTRTTARATFSGPIGGHVEEHITVTDSRGRVLSTTETIPLAGTSTTTFEYDAQGRQTRIRYADDAGVTLVYDAAGRLRQRTDCTAYAIALEPVSAGITHFDK